MQPVLSSVAYWRGTDRRNGNNNPFSLWNFPDPFIDAPATTRVFPKIRNWYVTLWEKGLTLKKEVVHPVLSSVAHWRETRRRDTDRRNHWIFSLFFVPPYIGKLFFFPYSAIYWQIVSIEQVHKAQRCTSFEIYSNQIPIKLLSVSSFWFSKSLNIRGFSS